MLIVVCRVLTVVLFDACRLLLIVCNVLRVICGVSLAACCVLLFVMSLFVGCCLLRGVRSMCCVVC